MFDCIDMLNSQPLSAPQHGCTCAGPALGYCVLDSWRGDVSETHIVKGSVFLLNGKKTQHVTAKTGGRAGGRRRTSLLCRPGWSLLDVLEIYPERPN